MTDRNPQKDQMAHASMVRTLRLQTMAVWPQEEKLLSSYRAPVGHALDAGCGTGEFSWRFASRFPQCTVHGVDILPTSIARARAAADDWPEAGSRVTFSVDDLFHLTFPRDTFDFIACRHVVQSIPEPEDVLAELIRVGRDGARIHLVVEDYAMIHHSPTRTDTDLFWHRGPIAFGAATGTDLRVGRAMPALLRKLGIQDVKISYLTVDSERVDRTILRGIFESWRDGYADVIAAHTELELDEVHAAFADMIACLSHPSGYAVWFLPVVSGVISK